LRFWIIDLLGTLSASATVPAPTRFAHTVERMRGAVVIVLRFRVG
jgi:hypothetical protein